MPRLSSFDDVRRGQQTPKADKLPVGVDDGLIGTTIDGRYVVRRFIGRGGMGSVYEGEQLTLSRKVAIKVMARELVGSERDRFRREARLASRVIHEHVVQVYDVSTTPTGEEVIIMEYVEARDLGALLDEGGALEPTRAIAITRAMLSALTAIHELGIVHRDIKPSNVLLARRGSDTDFVKLVDFGIARGGGEASLTSTGHVVGTPQYMSPEQFRGSAVDARTDLYAVGITLFAMLAGRVPFDGGTAEIGMKQVYEQPPEIRTLRPDVPPHLASTVMRALAKNPADRFASAAEFAEALTAPVMPTPARKRLWPWLLAGATIAAGGVLGAVFARRAHAPVAAPMRDGATADARVIDARAIDAPAIDAAAIDAAAIDAPAIDAPIRGDAGTTRRPPKGEHVASKPAGNCQCIPTSGPDILPLCPQKGRPLCRCDDEKGQSLCASKLTSCSEADLESAERRTACANAISARCAEPGWDWFTRPGKQDDPCSGYHVYDRAEGAGPRDIKKTGHLECDACPGANTRTYHGAVGAPCAGYYWRSGQPLEGTLQHCE